MLCGNHCADLTYMPLEANCGMILEEREILNPPLCFLSFGVILALLEKLGFLSWRKIGFMGVDYIKPPCSALFLWVLL